MFELFNCKMLTWSHLFDVVNPVGDEGLAMLWSPLWCHMTNTSECEEVKSIIVSLESCNLGIFSVPCSPFTMILEWPVKLLQPSLCTICWDSAISVSRIEDHSIICISQNWVYPDWGLILQVIIGIQFVWAHFPCLIVPGRNVQSRLYISSVQIVGLIVTNQGLILLSEFAEPWCVFLWCHSSGVCSFLAVEEDSTSSVFLLTCDICTFSIIIINEVIWPLISYRLRDIWTSCASNAWSNSIEIIDTAVVIIRGVVGSGDHVEAPHRLWYTWCIIKIPICGSISNGHTFEIIECADWSCNITSVWDVVLQIALIKLPGEIRKIDASITFSGKIKVICLFFWICSKEHFDGFEKIFRLSHIILSPVCFSTSSWESDSCWAFNVQKTCINIPSMWVFNANLVVVVKDIWPIFSKKS